jgi:hypothetical protein
VGLQYVGKADAVSTKTPATKQFTESVMVDSLTEGQVNSTIAAIYAPFANKTEADAKDSTLATQAYIQQADLLRVPLSQKDVNNGVPSLGKGRRVNPVRVNRASTQRFPKGLYTPPAYNADDVVGISAEQALYAPFTIADPGFAYRLLVHGQVDGKTGATGVYPQVVVRTGSTVGEIIAKGNGLGEAYGSPSNNPNDGFEYTTTDLYVTDWALTDGPGSTAGAGSIGADGHAAYYRAITGSPCFKRARRVNTADAITPSDYQEITCQLAAVPSGPNAYNDFFVRLAPNFAGWVRFRVYGTEVDLNFSTAADSASLVYATSSAMTYAVGDIWKIITGYQGNSSSLAFLKNGTELINWGGNVFVDSIIDSGHRGWAFGLGGRSGSVPAKLASITINDGPLNYNSSPINIIPVNYLSQTIKIGPTTLYIRASRQGGTSTVAVSNDFPSLHIMAVPA